MVTRRQLTPFFGQRSQARKPEEDEEEAAGDGRGELNPAIITCAACIPIVYCLAYQFLFIAVNEGRN